MSKARYQNYIVLDVETGGLDAEKCALTQFACIVYDGMTLQEITRYKTYVQNSYDLEITDKAREVTGITDKDIEGGITEKDLILELMEIFKQGRVSMHKAYKPIMVAHNAEFDRDWMKVVFERNFGKKHPFHKYIDEVPFCTMKLDKFTNPNKNGDLKFGLEFCCDRIGIELVDGHDAMNDVISTSELFFSHITKLRGEGGSGVSLKVEEEKIRDDFKFEM